MDLTTYINQDEPQRVVTVELKPGEFTRHSSFEKSGERFTKITVNAFPKYAYLLKGRGGFLYGNGKKSCFFVTPIHLLN